MRYCPFCRSENVDEASQCSVCVRRLPPLPPRRRKESASELSSVNAPTNQGSLAPIVPLPVKAAKEKSVSARVGTPSLLLSISKPESVLYSDDDWKQEVEEIRSEKAEQKSQALSTSLWPAVIAPLPEEHVFVEPTLRAMPSMSGKGLWHDLKYEVDFERGKWQRRGVIKKLRQEIAGNTAMLDTVLGALGKETRRLQIDNKALESENKAIDSAVSRQKAAQQECTQLSSRQSEENNRYGGSESERESKVQDAETALEEKQIELGTLKTQKKELREERKGIETRKKGYLKTADSRDAESIKEENSALGLEMKEGAQSLRRDAALLDGDIQEVERKIKRLEGPIGQLRDRIGALKSDIDAAKQALINLREGHRQRLSEIDAAQGQKSRELVQAEAEITRREITLGTLINLNRIKRPEFEELYAQVDAVRGGITARTSEIDRLSAQREVFDKSARVRGALTIAGLIVLLFLMIAIVQSLL